MMSSVWVTWPTLTKTLGGLGLFISLIVLAFERDKLLEKNLFDLETADYYEQEIVCDQKTRGARTLDGTCNSLENPFEGSLFTRFGRNVQPESVAEELSASRLMEPNPREVSNTLLGRDEFKPAETLNFIAAAWIQFMTHDWFFHDVDLDADPISVPVPEADPFFKPGSIIKVDPTPLSGGYITEYQIFDELNSQKVRVQLNRGVPSYQNKVTHWWDASQIYGVTPEQNNQIRAFDDGKLQIDSSGYIPRNSDGLPIQGFTENFWLGLSMLHNVFVKEHNAIADAIKSVNPEWDDQQIYDKARLINAALLAKIHTVEWTPAIIANPTTVRAMYANWWGLLGSTEPNGMDSPT